MLEFIADSNVLFSYFWKNSITKNIIFNLKVKLHSPIFALKEILKYKKEIIEKSKISESDFSEILKELKFKVNFIEEKFYLDSIEDASIIYDKNDIEFVALAMKLKLPIWSNDKELKRQNLAPVLNTEELIDILF